MKVYVSPLLQEDLCRVASGQLETNCLAFCSYLVTTAFNLGLAENEYVAVSSRTERRIFTSRFWGPMLDTLTMIGALEKSPRPYRKGSHCNAYRLAAKYVAGAREVEIDAPQLAKRIGKAANGTGPQTPAHHWLQQVYLDRTTFHPSVLETIADLDGESEWVRFSITYQYKLFCTKDPKFCVHKQSGRVCYLPNLLAKRLRSHLLIDGKETTEVDVSSSQPRLLLALYERDCPEAAAFAEFLDLGDASIYERMGDWIAQEFYHRGGKTDAFRQIFFGPRHMHGSYPLWTAFAERFPILAAIVEKEKAKSRSAFPVMLQGREAAIMIGGVATECAERGIPLLSIHDGVRVKERDAKMVAEIIARHWAANTGRPPKIKIGAPRADAA